MRSMTGFGSGSTQLPEQGIGIEVEISSVNRKTLDAYINFPREWSGLEQNCLEWLKGHFTRGRVNVQIKATQAGGGGIGLTVSDPALDESLARLRRYAETHQIQFKPDARFLLELAKTVKDSVGLPDWKGFETPIKAAFDDALADITRMRESEGTALAKDLLSRIDELDTLVSEIEASAARASATYRDALLDRLKQLDLELDLGDERVIKEVAIFADRCDISEEITRLRSHLEQFRTFIGSDEPCGRKMDFLCQEIHREFNTAGSKTTQVQVTRIVIEGKNALERIREQVQNVE
ncbi:MAG: YicC/YloC family endoribonuclease [Opitutales bacterium]